MVVLLPQNSLFFGISIMYDYTVVPCDISDYINYYTCPNMLLLSSSKLLIFGITGVIQNMTSICYQLLCHSNKICITNCHVKIPRPKNTARHPGRAIFPSYYFLLPNRNSMIAEQPAWSPDFYCCCPKKNDSAD